MNKSSSPCSHLIFTHLHLEFDILSPRASLSLLSLKINYFLSTREAVSAPSFPHSAPLPGSPLNIQLGLEPSSLGRGRQLSSSAQEEGAEVHWENEFSSSEAKIPPFPFWLSSGASHSLCLSCRLNYFSQ